MSGSTWVRRGGRALFAAVRGLFPRRFRGAHGREMTEAFDAELERRLHRSAWAGARYALRSSLDAARRGIEERTRGGRAPSGHGASDGEPKRRAPLGGITADVRWAARRLRRAPGFTLAATVVLGLGIGANAAVFSALRATVLARPAFPEADRLVIADLTRRVSTEADAAPFYWSFPKFLHLLDTHPATLEHAVGFANRAATITGVGPAERINLELVSPGYFEMLGLSPVMGRAFTPDELGTSPPPLVAVLSTELWRDRFGASPEAIGRDVVLDGVPLRVVGVAPEGFDGLTGGARLWVPMGAAGQIFSPFMVEEQGAHWFNVLARLAPGATVEGARAELTAVGDAIARVYPAPNAARVYSGSARALEAVYENPEASAAVVLLTYAAAMLLLVACANLSGLLIARARHTARDGAVRLAVGASRWRLVRASLVESFVLALIGGAVGVAIAVGGTRVMAAEWPTRFTGGAVDGLRVVDPSRLGVDGTVLVFTLVLSVGVAVLLGIAPALRASRADVAARLRDGSGATRRAGRILGMDLRAALVGTQVALALVLLTSASLLGGSVLRLLSVDEGFDTRHLVSFSYTIPTTSSHVDDLLGFHGALTERLEALPGVVSATFGCPPLRGHCIVTGVDAILGGRAIEPGEGPDIGVRMIDDGHFEKLGIPVLRGRGFEPVDGTDSTPTVVINRIAARELFGDDDPIGRRIELGMSDDGKEELSEVIGVVGDVLYGPRDRPQIAEAYYSMREFPENHGNITVRTVGDPLAAVPEMRRVFADLDPAIAMYRVETIDQMIGRSVGDRRATLALLAAFAAVTVLLTATGTWGIVAYSVADRRRELGLRLALGAGEGRVLRSVLVEGTRSALLGLAIGAAGAVLVSRLLESLLWQTDRTDPLAYGSSAVALFAIVALASWLPARRATAIDPVEALRAE